MVTKKKKKKVVSKKKMVAKKVKRKPAKTKKKAVITKNYLMMVLDESTSMGSIKSQAISAFNEQIKTVKENSNGIEVVVDLVKFSSTVSVVFQNEKISKVKNLTEETYTPNSMTAMYDGVGKAIELLQARPDINDPNVSVLMLIISDGEENSSKYWSASKVAEQLKSLQATGRWTVTYAGANQDLGKISATLNIPLGNTVMFAASAAGMTANNSLRSVSTSKLYASYGAGGASVSSFYSPDPKTTDATDPDAIPTTPKQ
jgi:hypothetical protein